MLWKPPTFQLGSSQSDRLPVHLNSCSWRCYLYLTSTGACDSSTAAQTRPSVPQCLFSSQCLDYVKMSPCCFATWVLPAGLWTVLEEPVPVFSVLPCRCTVKLPRPAGGAGSLQAALDPDQVLMSGRLTREQLLGGRWFQKHLNQDDLIPECFTSWSLLSDTFLLVVEELTSRWGSSMKSLAVGVCVQTARPASSGEAASVNDVSEMNHSGWSILLCMDVLHWFILA